MKKTTIRRVGGLWFFHPDLLSHISQLTADVPRETLHVFRNVTGRDLLVKVFRTERVIPPGGSIHIISDDVM